MLTQDEKKLVWGLVEPLQTGMLITVENNIPQARPMQLVQKEFDGIFYFFTAHPTEKTAEILQNKDICLVFSCPKALTYVSLSGQASISKDRELIDRFWDSSIAVWFTHGKEDPLVSIIKVSCYQGEYWQGKGNTVTQLFKYAKSMITGEKPDIAKHGKL